MHIKQLQPYFTNQDSINVLKTIKSKYVTENTETIKFENKLKKITKAKYVCCFNSGSSALLTALKILNLKKNDEIIIPNITYIASINAPLFLNHKIKLAEIDHNLGIDFNKIDKLINNNTKVLILCHLYGYVVDINQLNKFKKKYPNIIIIEDAAEALGCKYNKIHLGNFGKMGILSFYANKIITTGEGGAVITNNKNLFKKLKVFKNDGRIKRGNFNHPYFGLNFRFTDLQASIGNAQLNRFNKILKQKKYIFNQYYQNLKSIKQIEFLYHPNELVSNYWIPIIKTSRKHELKKFLNSKKIETRDIFKPLSRQLSVKKNNLFLNKNYKFPYSNKLFKICIGLPSHYLLKENELKYVIKNIKMFFNN